MAAENAGGAKSEETRKGAQGQQGEAAKEQRKQQGKEPAATQMARREPAWPSLLGATGWGGSPFMLMRRMFDDLDRMFEEFTGVPAGRELQRGAVLGEGLWAPQVDVLEREGKLVVRADLPGVGKDDLSVEMTDDGLILQGERRREVEEEKEGVYRRERRYGSFRRLIPLPEGVDPETADARFHDGVLEVAFDMPKERGRGKRIEIQAGEKPAVH